MKLRLAHSDDQCAISSPEEIIAEAQRGRMFILSDDEDRENEGDLIIPAQFATPEAINFMAKHGRGLICLALEQERIQQLGLPLMAQQNSNPQRTAFTVSIEAREGVTTGISAADRAHTIQTAIAPQSGPQNIVTPGHVFPLLAKEGGVLVRAGHTEAAVDIARMAGLTPASVICEIMNEDGSMARMSDLIRFAQFHNLKVGTVADLIAYRRRTETIVERRLTTQFTSMHGGDFAMHIYVNKVAYAEHVALVKGDLTRGDEPILVRMHALNVLEDVLGDRSHGHGGELQASMRMIADAGRGVIVLLRDAQAASLSQKLERRMKGEEPSKELRDYGIGAQILLDLGVRDMILLSNSQKTIVGLDGYGLRVVEQKTIKV
ncbi:MAG: 3,4-dihydroxy-2-butanone-4-phosphate synthase [Alphaproteobacteria bacterium]|nr:3,4-dihydroxy-2-butanone-4-phosphate synthase [Alphaproteobacteria bacterium]